MKAILVMEMPGSCADCKFSYGYAVADYCSVPGTMIATGSYVTRRPDQCPLKPMPERKGKNKYHNNYEKGLVDGFNSCIDSMEGSKG